MSSGRRPIGVAKPCPGRVAQEGKHWPRCPIKRGSCRAREDSVQGVRACSRLFYLDPHLVSTLILRATWTGGEKSHMWGMTFGKRPMLSSGGRPERPSLPSP